MSVTRADVERIAELAALEVDEASLPTLTRQIAGILEYVSQLEKVQGGAEMPGLSYAPGLRADATRPADLAVAPGSIAPSFKDGLFLVPRLGGVGSATAPEDDE